MTVRNARCNDKDSPSTVCFVRYNTVKTWRHNLLVQRNAITRETRGSSF